MTLWHLATAIVETARISVPTIVGGLTGRLTAEQCDARLLTWSRKLLEQADVDLHVAGLDNLPAGEAFVVMSNHQSVYDIPVMFQALPRRVRMVAKSELFKIPGWGPAMRMSGFVEVNRGDREAAIRSLESAKTALADGTSIWIAPEGTRGPGDHLLPFKKGGFILAIETGARILPVSIGGTSQVLSAHGRTVRNGLRVQVTVHEPIAADRYGMERRDELIADVRRSISSSLALTADR
jgi:1-acyl-sn-glycerol-3-phosphate acyltransferase